MCLEPHFNQKSNLKFLFSSRASLFLSLIGNVEPKDLFKWEKSNKKPEEDLNSL